MMCSATSQYRWMRGCCYYVAKKHSYQQGFCATAHQSSINKSGEEHPSKKEEEQRCVPPTTESSPSLHEVNALCFDAEKEQLTEEQQEQKRQLIHELQKRLSGPLADENGNIPTGKNRPTAIEVDGPSHFYANSDRYTAYTKLKHRLLTRMGYRVLHVPYFEWRKMRGAKEREEYMRTKLLEEPTEWLDPDDEKFYNERMVNLRNQYGDDNQNLSSSSSSSSSSPT